MEKVGIIGAGSIGLLLAAYCAKQDENIILYTHSEEQAKEINMHGIQCSENQSIFKTSVDAVPFSRLNNSHPPLDWIFLTVKQQHLDSSFLMSLKKVIDKNTKLLCFQNGLGHIEKLSKVLPDLEIFTAVTTEGALKTGHCHVQHTGHGSTGVGHYHLMKNKEKEENHLHIVSKYLQKAGFSIYVSKNINNVVWKKLIINSVVNPVTAIVKIRNGELLQSSPLLDLMKKLFDESFSVAKHMDVELDSEALWIQLLDVCKKTANNQSSMLQDILANKRTEIDWINGSFIQLAQRYQLPIPTHESVYLLVKSMERN